MKYVRAELELTQDEMSRLLGISKNLVNKIEHGRVKASREISSHLLRLHDLYAEYTKTPPDGGLNPQEEEWYRRFLKRMKSDLTKELKNTEPG